MKKRDIDVVKELLDSRETKIGFLKRKPENEVDYIFKSADRYTPGISDIKTIGFNVRYFVDSSIEAGTVSYSDFTIGKTYTTYFAQAVNGNLYDANLVQNAHAMYVTELYSHVPLAIPLIMKMEAAGAASTNGRFAVYIDGSPVSNGSFTDSEIITELQLEGGEFNRLVIFVSTNSTAPVFKIIGNFGHKVNSWRLPPPSIPVWEFGYPTNRKHNDHIELKWDVESFYSIGDTAHTVIEYSTASGGPFSEIAAVNYDTHYYVQTALACNSSYWYRLRTRDITSNTSSYSDVKNGSTIFGNFPVIDVTISKNNEEWQYFKADDIMDVKVVSSVPLTDTPEFVIIHPSGSATGEGICYASDEFAMLSNYYYPVTNNGYTTVSGATPALMPEGTGNGFAMGNIFGSSNNLARNGNFGARYLETGNSYAVAHGAYIEVSGWHRGGVNASISYPRYCYENEDTGIMGPRYVKVGGPCDIDAAGNSVANYSSGGAWFYGDMNVTGVCDDATCLSVYTRIDDAYDTPNNWDVSEWQPKMWITYYSGGAASGTKIDEENFELAGTKDWYRSAVTLSTPAGTDVIRIRLSSAYTGNYVCDGCFQDIDTWWTIFGDGGDVSYSGSTDTRSPTNGCLWVSGEYPINIKQNDVAMIGLPDNVTYSVWLKAERDMPNKEYTLKYRDALSGGGWGHSLTSSGITRMIGVSEWSRLYWTIDSSWFNVSATGVEFTLVLPTGTFYVTAAQAEIGNSPTTWKPGDLRVNFDGIMLESGSEPSSSYRNREDEFGAYSYGQNLVYFDYTPPVGGMYISAINEFTSNDAQIVTTSRNVYIIPTGDSSRAKSSAGVCPPYDYFGIRYIQLINSGDCFPTGNDIVGTGTWTSFEYTDWVPYNWSLDVSGVGEIGNGTGPRWVYCRYEDMAGNKSTVSSDSIIYQANGLPAPSGVYATGRYAGANEISWLPITGNYDPYNLLDRYQVMSWSATGDFPDVSLSIWAAETQGTGMIHGGVESATAYSYAVRCIDVGETKGEWSGLATCTSYDYNDDMPPAAPFVSGLTSEAVTTVWGVNIRVGAEIGHSGKNYDNTNCEDLHKIVAGIRRGYTGDFGDLKYHVWTETPPLTFPTGVDLTFYGLEPYTYYEVSAFAEDTQGNQSAWCTPSGITTAFDTEPPPAVGWFNLYAMYRSILANWELNPVWDFENFVILRGDLWYSGGTLADTCTAGTDIITLGDNRGVSGGDIIVIEPNGGNEGRYIASGQVAESVTQVRLKGFANNTHAISSDVVVYRPLTYQYRGPYTDEDLDPATTYYYNIMAIDESYLVSLAYDQHLAAGEYTNWPSATTKDINDVGVDWNFLAEVVAVNKVKNSSFEIPAGDGTEAMFWDSNGDAVRTDSYAKKGNWSCAIGGTETVTSTGFPCGTGEHMLSFYGYDDDSAPPSIDFTAKVYYQTNGGPTWLEAETHTFLASEVQTWERFITGVTMPDTAVSGRLYFEGGPGSTKVIDAVMFQEGPWLTQWVPYSDEFVLGTEMISHVEIYSGGILAPNIGANQIWAQHILGGAIGTHHLTVAERRFNAEAVQMYPNRYEKPPWNDSSDIASYPNWPDGDDTWYPDCIYWSSGTVWMQSGGTYVQTYNQWNIGVEVESGSYSANESWEETYYIALDYDVTTNGEPKNCVGTVQILNDLPGDPGDSSKGRVLLGRWKTGTDALDPSGGTFHSFDLLGTTIEGENIRTGTIEARLITAGAINAEHIAANQIVAEHISGGSINVGHIEVGSRARTYGHNIKFYPDTVLSYDVIKQDGGSFWTTGETYNIGTEVEVYYPHDSVDANAIYYLYYDTLAQDIGFTGEDYANDLISGYLYPLASFRYTTDGGGDNAFEINHIRAWGTYIDGSRISAHSVTAEEIHAGTITADEIAADAIEAEHISAGSIETDHFYAATISGVTFRATGPSGDTYLNEDGDSNDLRIYDADGQLRLNIGQDVSQSFYDFAPDDNYGIRIDSGSVIIDNSDFDLDRDCSNPLESFSKNYSFYNRYFNLAGEEWFARYDGDYRERGTLYAFYSNQAFNCQGLKPLDLDDVSACIPWRSFYVTCYNALDHSECDSNKRPAGVRGIEFYVVGEGMRGVPAWHDYGEDGPYLEDSMHGILPTDVCAVLGYAKKLRAQINYCSNIIGGAFIAHADRQGGLSDQGIAIGLYCAVDGNDPSNKNDALITYGNLGLFKSNTVKDSGGAVLHTTGVKGIITISGLDFKPVGGGYFDAPKLGSADYRFQSTYLKDTGYLAIGEAKIKQSNNLPYMESGMKVASGEVIYLGNKEIKEVDNKIRISDMAEFTSSGITPTGTVYQKSNIGKPEVGSEWHSFYLAETSGEDNYPGIYINYGWTLQESYAMYGQIYGRYNYAGDRAILGLVSYGAPDTKAQIRLDGYNENILTDGNIVPEFDSTDNIGSDSRYYAYAYIDDLLISNNAQIENDLTINGDVVVSGNLVVSGEITKGQRQVWTASYNTGNFVSSFLRMAGELPMAFTRGYVQPRPGYMSIVTIDFGISAFTTPGTANFTIYFDGVQQKQYQISVSATGYITEVIEEDIGQYSFASGAKISIYAHKNFTGTMTYPIVGIEVTQTG